MWWLSPIGMQLQTLACSHARGTNVSEDLSKHFDLHPSIRGFEDDPPSKAGRVLGSIDF
jgi:hypothetical protein